MPGTLASYNMKENLGGPMITRVSVSDGRSFEYATDTDIQLPFFHCFIRKAILGK